MNSSFGISIFLHAIVVGTFASVVYLEQPEPIKEQEFTVIEKFVVKEKVPPPPVRIERSKPKPAPKTESRKVYGVSRKSLRTSAPAPEAKLGNTLAKKVDREKLKDDDVDSIPIPADEFLITSMPRVLEEIRPVYPPSAKARQLEGKVIFEIIVDRDGLVRQVILLKGIEPEMDQSAAEAMKRFRFKPAMIDEQAVAAKIKYAINFVLER